MTLDEHARTHNPHLLHEWDDSTYSPEQLTPYSHRSVRWKCQADARHQWTASVYSRTRGTGCPYCSGHLVLREDSLAIQRPDIFAEWAGTNTLDAFEVSLQSMRRADFICPVGHTYTTVVRSRVNAKAGGCPVCTSRQQLSTPQLVVYTELQKMFPRTELEVPVTGGRRLDIYVPELNVAIEYDGRQFHQDIDRDLEKDDSIRQSLPGVRLIRLREPGCPDYVTGETEVILLSEIANYTTLIEKLFALLGLDVPDLDIDQLVSDVLLEQLDRRVKGSLMEHDPFLAAEWHPTKNAPATPVSVTPFSNRKVWWQCEKGHAWQATVANRSNGTGCPDCYREGRKRKEI